MMKNSVGVYDLELTGTLESKPDSGGLGEEIPSKQRTLNSVDTHLVAIPL